MPREGRPGCANQQFLKVQWMSAPIPVRQNVSAPSCRYSFHSAKIGKRESKTQQADALTSSEKRRTIIIETE